jgi:hypothetical protein
LLLGWTIIGWIACRIWAIIHPAATEQAVVNSDGRVSMYFVTNMGRSFQAGDNGQDASSRANGKDHYEL